mgnify:CR=1 FL=1
MDAREDTSGRKGKKKIKSFNDNTGQSAYPLHQSGSRSSHDNGSL